MNNPLLTIPIWWLRVLFTIVFSPFVLIAFLGLSVLAFITDFLIPSLFGIQTLKFPSGVRHDGIS